MTVQKIQLQHVRGNHPNYLHITVWFTQNLVMSVISGITKLISERLYMLMNILGFVCFLRVFIIFGWFNNSNLDFSMAWSSCSWYFLHRCDWSCACGRRRNQGMLTARILLPFLSRNTLYYFGKWRFHKCGYPQIDGLQWNCLLKITSSTAQGGGGSFKNRKPIGEVGCCESGMAERSHWWIERWLISLVLFSDYLPTYLSIHLSSYLSHLPI